ncbi:MAG: hypothetical protein ABFS34_13505 [Gemmatimonadota bacterium]
MNATETPRLDADENGHLSDAQLLALLDEEPEVREEWSAHAQGCGRCASDLARLQAQAAVVDGWFVAVEPQLRERVNGRRLSLAGRTVASSRAAGGYSGAPRAAAWLKAAAVVVLIAAPAAALPGVRDWLDRRVRGRPEVTAPSLSATGTAVRFTPVAGELIVSVEGAAGGRLVLERASNEDVVLRYDDDAVRVTLSELEVRVSGGGWEGDLRVGVPAAISSIAVRHASGLTVVQMASLADTVVIDLTAR